MFTEGQLFTEKYSHLPNILNEMDKLESQGKYWKEKPYRDQKRSKF